VSLLTPSGPVTHVVRTAIRVEGHRPGGSASGPSSTRAGDPASALAGLVGNDVDGVFAEVEGSPAAVAEFLPRHWSGKAPPSRQGSSGVTAGGWDGTRGLRRPFEIVASDPAGRRSTLIAADTATCADCLRELADPGDRRFGYPFINCTNCGPRFTIVRDVPLRPPADHDGPLRHVRAVRRRVPRPGQPPLPRPADLLPPPAAPRLTLLDAGGKPHDSGSLATLWRAQRSTIFS